MFLASNVAGSSIAIADFKVFGNVEAGKFYDGFGASATLKPCPEDRTVSEETESVPAGPLW